MSRSVVLPRALGDDAYTGRSGEYEVNFLPEPPAQERWATIISVDDHVVEPPDAFEGRLPAKYADAAPRVVDTDDGVQAWLWNDQLYGNVGLNAFVGRDWSGVEERREPS